MLAVTLVIAFLLGSATTLIADAASDAPFKVYVSTNKKLASVNWNTGRIVDKETGVNYLVVETDCGNGDRALAVVPRIDPMLDGGTAYYITPKKER